VFSDLPCSFAAGESPTDDGNHAAHADSLARLRPRAFTGCTLAI
jgi:hypothetical protein